MVLGRSTGSRSPWRVRAIWLIPAVVVTAVAVGGGTYAYSQGTTHLTVTGLNWAIYVNGSLLGYSYESETSGCNSAGCPGNALVSSVWELQLFVSFGSETYNLSVVNVTIPPPFHLVGLDPGLPFLLTPAGGGGATFQVAIQLPSSPGTYSLLGAVGIAK